MRLIDAERFENALNETEYDVETVYGDGNSHKLVCDVLETMPTVDAVPVRHGYWVIADADKGEYICSVCGETDTDCSDRYTNHNVFSQEYCPNCGAKMDGDEIERIEETLNATPTVDAVQVVRCRDCIHRDLADDCGCWYTLAAIGDDDFCSRGERT